MIGRGSPGDSNDEVGGHDIHRVRRKRVPGAGGFSGGPAKHCAIDIHALALAPATFSFVSATFRVCVTTWQNSTASPATSLSRFGSCHSHVAPDGAVSRT